MKKKSKKQSNEFLKGKSLLFLILILVSLFLFFFGTKLYLYINFMLGNDIIINLDANKVNFNITRDEFANVEFQSSVRTNPFCKAECTSSFLSLSGNSVIESERFDLKTGAPYKKSYNLGIGKLGEGLDLYQYNIECNGIKSSFCHTKEESTFRSLLITVKYNLNESEKILKTNSFSSLIIQKNTLEKIGNDIFINKNKVELINDKFDVTLTKQSLNDLEIQIDTRVDELLILQDLWDDQDYKKLSNNILQFSKSLNQNLITSNIISTWMIEDFTLYNKTVENLILSKSILDQINSSLIVSNLDKDNLLELHASFQNLSKSKNLQVINLHKSSEDILNASIELNKSIKSNLNKQYLRNLLKVKTNYQLFCNLLDNCNLNNISLNSYAESCNEIININNIYNSFNYTLTNSTLNANPLIKSTILEIIKDYNQSLFNETINEIYPFTSNPNLLNYTKADIYFSLKDFLPQPCISIPFNNSQIDISRFSKVNFTHSNFSSLINVSFNEPLQSCCVNGICQECCEYPNCSDINYPILFVHGHAFNKDVSAHYSLDAFNKIQKKLEDENYLNAGTMSLYSQNNFEESHWRLITSPLSIKVSYYLDLFKEPDNYVVIQTKTENIDTYSIRLNELINNVLEETGKNKVILITHSMGGLVSRRYLQLFGENKVSKLIMIGAPNNGVSGKVADYCNLKGEKLECRDLNSNSLFLNKLSRGKKPKIPVLNIIGSGCLMEKQDGDGIVLVNSAELDGVNNFVINGTCSKLSYLHTDLLDVDKYPETFNQILSALN
jgi:hypothetical protein